MAFTDLSTIRQKIRRITRSPSISQISDDDIDQYINTFLLYDFPEHLRTFNLRQTFSFYTNPYQDVYPTDKSSFGSNPSAQNNILYNFQNKYLTVHPPFYVAGYPAFFTQYRDVFFGNYPNNDAIQTTNNIGDGITTNFMGTVPVFTGLVVPPQYPNQQAAIIQRTVLFSSVDTNGNGCALVDIPVINPTTGNPTVNGNLYDPNSAAYQGALATPPTVIIPGNTINYSTGVYSITFTTAPAANQPILSQFVPTILARPQSVCYFADSFIVRPVPDQPYQIQFEVYVRPTELIQDDQIPDLEEYWQYIAYGAAKKIFEDRMDLDSVQMILPEFNKQQNLIHRRTIVQLANQRTVTIYSQGKAYYTSGWINNGSNFPF